jgi:hypothetical protein
MVRNIPTRMPKEWAGPHPHLVLLEEDLWIALKVAAAEERTSISSILRRLAERYLARRRRRTP